MYHGNEDWAIIADVKDSGIKFSLDGIGHQLEDRFMLVPIYQRSYSWRDDEVRDFCSDIRSAFSSDPSEYFLGTVILSKEGSDGRYTIIDGQQRMATTSILFGAIRDYFTKMGEVNRATGVHNKYIASYDMESDTQVPKLSLNSEDDEYYLSLVIYRDRSAKCTRPSHELMAQAMTVMDEFVEKIASDAGGDWIKRLVKWCEFLSLYVRVIYVEVPTESDAFMIFETLNDRGVDLTLADLLKNFLFGKAGTKLDVVRENWLLALGAFDMSTEMFITFLRHYWSSKEGLTRERDLYKGIKEGVTNRVQVVKFSEEIRDASRIYAALVNSEHDFWSSDGSTTKDNIDVLNKLALVQNRPMLLAAAQHFTKPELKKVLKAAVNWGVRGLIVGGIGGGKTEKTFCDAAVKIRAGSIKTLADLLPELTQIIASDEEFELSFAVARVTKPTLARYYLVALERYSANASNSELVPNSNEEDVDLEHVLPKRADVLDWLQFTPEEQIDWVDRIGNLALLQKAQNGRIGNRSFIVKRPILTMSRLRLTTEIGAKGTWTKKEIMERQQRLAELAVRVWPREI